MTQQAFMEIVKHFGRYVFWALLVIIADGLMKLVSGGSLNLSPLELTVATTIVGQLDQWVHNNQEIKANGLAPF